jgi:hypothetical protein
MSLDFQDQHLPRQAARSRAGEFYLDNLVDVLRTNPKGLRRWSVMRALRSRCEVAGREISLKFEDEVERVFMEFCIRDYPANGHGNAAGPRLEDALFYRPKERAGEIWAIRPEIAGAMWPNEPAASIRTSVAESTAHVPAFQVIKEQDRQ